MSFQGVLPDVAEGLGALPRTDPFDRFTTPNLVDLVLKS